LLSIIAAMLLASVSSAHTDPVVVPFNVIIGARTATCSRFSALRFTSATRSPAR
jgi:hypothetical protein